MFEINVTVNAPELAEALNNLVAALKGAKLEPAASKTGKADKPAPVPPADHMPPADTAPAPAAPAPAVTPALAPAPAPVQAPVTPAPAPARERRTAEKNKKSPGLRRHFKKRHFRNTRGQKNTHRSNFGKRRLQSTYFINCK